MKIQFSLSRFNQQELTEVENDPNVRVGIEYEFKPVFLGIVHGSLFNDIFERAKSVKEEHIKNVKRWAQDFSEVKEAWKEEIELKTRRIEEICDYAQVIFEEVPLEEWNSIKKKFTFNVDYLQSHIIDMAFTVSEESSNVRESIFDYTEIIEDGEWPDEIAELEFVYDVLAYVLKVYFPAKPRISPKEVDELLKPFDSEMDIFNQYSKSAPAVSREFAKFFPDYTFDSVSLLMATVVESDDVEKSMTGLDIDALYKRIPKITRIRPESAMPTLVEKLKSVDWSRYFRAVDSDYVVSEEYHGAEAEATKWRIEPDGSGFNMVEIISPPKTVAETLADMKLMLDDIKKHGNTDSDDFENQCGLHVNISVKGKTFDQANLLKPILLFDEGSILKFFEERKESAHLSFIQAWIKSKLSEARSGPFIRPDSTKISPIKKRKLDELEDKLRKSYPAIYKFMGINLSSIADDPDKQRVEFRYIGGKGYEDKYDIIKHQVLKNASYVTAAFSATFLQKEYRKYLHRLSLKVSASYAKKSIPILIGDFLELDRVQDMTNMIIANISNKRFLLTLLSEKTLNRLSFRKKHKVREVLSILGMRPEIQHVLGKRSIDKTLGYL